MNASAAGPLSYGQLSLWRDIEGLPRGRWHEVNSWSRWHLPDGVDTERVRQALRALAARHPSLRTRYDLTDPASPRQEVAVSGDPETIEGPLERDLVTEATDLVNRPFDLRTEFGWRSRVIIRGGRPTDVLLVRHHMVADGWCGDVMEEDFRAFLRDPTASVATGPLDLAAWQHGAPQERMRAAATGYWERVLAHGAGSGFPAADPRGVAALRCTLRSRRAHAGATELAARTGTSVSTVVLAAFTLAVARVTGIGDLVAQPMCANRFSPRWRRVVTSMNQWTVAALTAVDDLAEHTSRVHRAVLTAYRYGMYDVDTMAGLRAQAARRAGVDAYETTCAYNFISLPDFSGPPVDDPEPVWDEPFSTIGHNCYLRVAEEAGTLLALRMRTKGIEKERVAAVMEHMHSLLTASVRVA
jgi:hypothetical protein